MTEDLEEHEDELLALQSIFDADEFVRDESKSAGEIRVCVELPVGFSVALREGKSEAPGLSNTRLLDRKGPI